MSLKPILFIAVFCSLTSVSAQGTANDSIIVAGRIISAPGNNPKTLTINECDYSEKSERRITERDSEGRFHEKIPFSYGHTFSVNYNGVFVNAYAEPGDSIFMEIDMTENPATFRLSGDKAEINEQYSHGAANLMKMLYDVRLPADTTALPEYLAAFKRETGRTKAALEKYISENALLPQVADMLLRDNIFTIANQALLYRGRNKEEQLAFFTDSIFDLFNEKNARVMIFPYHLGALTIDFPDYVKNAPKGIVRDLMYVSLEKNDESVPKREDFYNTAYYDRIFGNRVTELNLSGISEGDIIVAEKDSTYNITGVNPVDWMKKRFAGRPIYLDVSATWCGPCRASLANSETLRDYFKNTDIVFVVLWLKSDLDEWKKLIPDINNAIHIFVPDEDMSNRLMGALKLRGFPTCYMISRDGAITVDGVPHFHSPELIDYLNGSLK